MSENIPINTFFDINKLPSDWGLLLFPISMTLVANKQMPDEILEQIRIFNPSKIEKPVIGLNFLYGESLYTTYEHETNGGSLTSIRYKFITEAQKHKNRMKKIIGRLSTTEFQIPSALNYQSWDHSLLNTKGFPERFAEVKNIYHKDELFQKYMKEDCDFSGRELTEAQVNFFLEEHLLVYLIQKGETYFHNNYVQGRENWILWCYLGKPPKSLVYLFQLNPFKLDNPKNKYQNIAQYDLVDKKLYDTENIDLNTWNYE